jgi:hypothetical protein
VSLVCVCVGVLSMLMRLGTVYVAEFGCHQVTGTLEAQFDPHNSVPLNPQSIIFSVPPNQTNRYRPALPMCAGGIPSCMGGLASREAKQYTLIVYPRGRSLNATVPHSHDPSNIYT